MLDETLKMMQGDEKTKVALGRPHTQIDHGLTAK